MVRELIVTLAAYVHRVADAIRVIAGLVDDVAMWMIDVVAGVPRE